MKTVPCRTILLALIVVFTIDSGLATGQMAGQASPANRATLLPAGPKRPANVPEGYVVTPFGYFHPSCVQTLSVGERQLADGRVQHADGTVEESAAVCNYARYSATGLPLAAGKPAESGTRDTVLPETDGWIENANITTGSSTKSYGAMVATWTVPLQPANQVGQYLFYFPGFEDINDSATSILQPVLTWAGGQWSVSNWNCCLKNIAVESTVVDVKVGDKIFGSITSTCKPGTLTCATWNVLSVDLTTGYSTTLSDTPSEGQIFNWAFGGVLEAYYVVACKDYPEYGRFSFTGVTVFDENLLPIASPLWTTGHSATVTPQCDYDVIAGPNSVELVY